MFNQNDYNRYMYYFVLSVVIICICIGYYIFQYTDHGYSDQIRTTIQSAKQTNERSIQSVQKSAQSIRSARETTQNISDTNNQLQNSQRETERAIQSASNELQSIKNTYEEYQRERNQIEYQFTELDRNFKQFERLQSEGTAILSTAESAINDANDTAYGIRKEFIRSEEQFRDYENATREIGTTIQQLRKLGEENKQTP